MARRPIGAVYMHLTKLLANYRPSFSAKGQKLFDRVFEQTFQISLFVGASLVLLERLGRSQTSRVALHALHLVLSFNVYEINNLLRQLLQSVLVFPAAETDALAQEQASVSELATFGLLIAALLCCLHTDIFV